MTRSIDQDPSNYQFNSNPEDSNIPLETVNIRGSQSGFGDDKVPSTANPRPHRIDVDPDREHKEKRGRRIVALSALGAIAATGALYFGAKSAVNEIYASTPGSANSGEIEFGADLNDILADGSSNPEVDASDLDIRTYPHQSFVELPYSIQLEKATEYLEEAIEKGAYQKYLADNKAANGYAMAGGIGTNSINDPEQEILNRMVVKENIIFKESNYNLAKNLVSGIYHPDSAVHDAVINHIGDGKAMTPTIIDTFGASAVYTQGQLGDLEFNGTPSRLIKTFDPVAGILSTTVVQEFRSEENPNETHVIAVRQFNVNNASFVVEPKNWKPYGR